MAAKRLILRRRRVDGNPHCGIADPRCRFTLSWSGRRGYTTRLFPLLVVGTWT